MPAHHPLTLRHYFRAQSTAEANTALENIQDSGKRGHDNNIREVVQVIVLLGVIVMIHDSDADDGVRPHVGVMVPMRKTMMMQMIKMYKGG